VKDADEYQKEEIYKEKLIDKENRKLAVKALLLYIDKKVQDSELRTNAFKVVEEKKFKKFVNEIANPHLTPDFYKWKYYSKQSSAIKLNIRLIFKVIEFDSTSTDMNDAIKFFKKYITSNKLFSDYKFKEIPITFIPSAIKKIHPSQNKIW
jgi:two-component SAPR family response regulator